MRAAGVRCELVDQLAQQEPGADHLELRTTVGGISIRSSTPVVACDAKIGRHRIARLGLALLSCTPCAHGLILLMLNQTALRSSRMSGNA